MEPFDIIPPGHGETDSPAATGRGNNVQPDWTPDLRPVPPTPQEDIDF